MTETVVHELTSIVRRLIEEQLSPLADEVERTGELPANIIESMADIGLFGITIPVEYGGIGLGMAEYTAIAREMSRAHQAFRSIININNGIGSRSLVLFGTEDQKNRFLPGLAAGQRLAAFALTEPDGGSDINTLNTRAVWDERSGTYVINGTKQFITNGPIADTILVIARTAYDDVPSGERYSAFVIDTVDGDPAGLVRGRADEKMGFTGSKTSQLLFEDCRVAPSALVGSLGDGLRVALSAVNDGRITISAAAVGAAEYLLEEALGYARTRVQGGKPIIEHQAIGHCIANMAIDIELARHMLANVARVRDSGEGNLARLASILKVFATEMAWRAADSTVQIFGGYGYVKEFPIERFYRDLRLFRIVEGTSEIQRNFIVRDLLRHGSGY